ncbi:MAG: hypothetical protein HKP27_13720 [Myxococcales bacterium]|nr:hypothetical protein [Myxococcales bacterium]
MPWMQIWSVFSCLTLIASVSGALPVTSFEVTGSAAEPALSGVALLPQDQLPPLPPGIDPATAQSSAPLSGFAIPFPDGSNTLFVTAGGFAAIGVPDFIAAEDGGIWNVAFPAQIAFENPVSEVSFTFTAILAGANPGNVTAEAFDASGVSQGATGPAALTLDGMGIGPEGFVSLTGSISSVVFVPGDAPNPGEGWAIDFVSAETIQAVPEPGAALLFGIGVLWVARARGRRC